MKSIVRKSFFLLLVLIISGCSSTNVSNTNKFTITKEINDIISNYIINSYKEVYPKTDKQFEEHKIYGYEENKNIISIYMFSRYESFNKESKSKSLTGHAFPVLIKLEKIGSQYKVIDYKEPANGSDYKSSIKKMYPSKYVNMAINDNTSSKELEEEISRKVIQWLKNP